MSAVVYLRRAGGRVGIKRAQIGNEIIAHGTIFFALADPKDVRVVRAVDDDEPPYTLWLGRCAIDLRNNREAQAVCTLLGIDVPTAEAPTQPVAP